LAYDILIKNGTVVDGSGLSSYRADVGIRDGKIAAIGKLAGEAAKETIDAEGHIVSPGFVDGHTHMDAQLFWDPIGSCACWHGVTSVVMGNCGFSLAPCAEKDKALVLRNFEKAEDIPREAMESGIPWSWTTFSEFLDSVDRLPKGINYAGYVGHSALRTYVMGERAFTETAGADDMAAMTRELESGLRAGAIGFSTSRSHTHRTPEGRPVASRLASRQEVEDLIGVMSDLGTGVFELARENTDNDPEKRKDDQDWLSRIAIDTGVPITFGSPWYRRTRRDIWRGHFAMVDAVTAQGGKVLVQGPATWQGSLRSFETMMPYDKAPLWADFRKLPLAEQERGLRDPAMRARLVDAAKNYKHNPDPTYHNALIRPPDWNWIFPLDKPLPPYRSVAEIAEERNQHPSEVIIDMALAKNMKMLFVNPANNEDQDVVLAMIRHPRSAVTFSDAGAHVASTVNPVQTHLLGYWVRERQGITMEEAVRKITFDIASFWGLAGRGLLREGYHADVVVFDPKTIAPELPEMAYDLPKGGGRMKHKATGIKTTIVNGKVFLRDNEATGALAGRLLRGPLAARN
jgi:N-acyl-D-amino-acid deacylase